VRVDSDGLQYSSPPVEGLVLHNSCTLPVNVVILLVDMDRNAILLIKSPHSLLVLCEPLLQSSSCLAHVDMVTVMAGNLVDSSLLLLRYSVLHIDKGLSDGHKENTPLRPNVTAVGSPTYRLANKLACILSPLTGQPESFVKNSAEFAQEVRDMELSEEDVMLSFDVVSLFTRG